MVLEASRLTQKTATKALRKADYIVILSEGMTFEEYIEKMQMSSHLVNMIYQDNSGQFKYLIVTKEFIEDSLKKEKLQDGKKFEYVFAKEKKEKKETGKKRKEEEKEKEPEEKKKEDKDKKPGQGSGNAGILDFVSKLQKHYQMEGDKGRAIGYGKVLAALKAYPHEITCAKELDDVEGIGDKMRKKIQEFLDTGGLAKYDKVLKSSKMDIVEQLT